MEAVVEKIGTNWKRRLVEVTRRREKRKWIVIAMMVIARRLEGDLCFVGVYVLTMFYK